MGFHTYIPTAAWLFLQGLNSVPGVVPTTSTFPTAWLATGVTQTTFSASEGAGLVLRYTSAAAAVRCSLQLVAGTSIAVKLNGNIYGGSTQSDNGPAIALKRADGRILTLGFSQATAALPYLVCLRMTDKDTYSSTAPLLSLLGRGKIDWIRIRETGGNVQIHASADGLDWGDALYDQPAATAYGTSGSTTHVGVGAVTSQNGQVAVGLFERVIIL